MTQANFRFISDALDENQFTVVGFNAEEGLSRLYRYEIEVKAPIAAAIELDDVLDAPARFESGWSEQPVSRDARAISNRTSLRSRSRAPVVATSRTVSGRRVGAVRVVVIVPTYDEVDNVEPLCRRIRAAVCVRHARTRGYRAAERVCRQADVRLHPGR